MALPKDNRVILLAGAGLVIVAAVVLALIFTGGGDKPTEAPPASKGGLVVNLAEAPSLEPTRELRCFVDGQFVGMATLADCARRNGLATDALNQMFVNNKVDVIIAQTNGAAWVSTLGKGDAFSGPSASQLPAVAGFPHLTVPMGLSGGLPIGLSFIGPKWHDHDVLKAGFAYEQLSKARVAPTFPATIASR
jgi:hypothetical protein